MGERFSITLNQLTYFRVCAKQLNMTAASQELYVAQSAVSAAINHLEHAVGAPLFLRQHAKGLALTPAGESLLRDTNELFDLLTSSIDAIHDTQNQVRGTVRVACFSTIAPILLPRLLHLLHDRYPDLTVDVIEGNHANNIAALRSGRAEIAINYNYALEDGLSHETLGQIAPYALVSADHRLADHETVALSDLTDEELILLDLPDTRDYFLNMFNQQGLTPRLRYRSPSYETVRSMVAEGLGYTILNQRPLTNLTYTGKTIISLDLSDPLPELGITLTSLPQTHRSARTRAVATAAKELLQPQQV